MTAPLSTAPGRQCPLHYRYGAAALARAAPRQAATLYVVGGLYGNLSALDAIEAMAGADRDGGSPTLCFNGDFNWFDVDDAAFAQVNARVLAHDAILGNVEAEFGTPSDDAGCGCGYPDDVDDATVERSNRIHRRLKTTAARHPALTARIAALPMFARYRVGGLRVGVVHGDADALAGWRFDVSALDDPLAAPWLADSFARAEVDLFASTHTCLPAMRRFASAPTASPGPARWIVNNGAAGMPNFDARSAAGLAGLCTRIATTPSPHPVLHERRVGDVHVALLPVRYDETRWLASFLAQWPPGTPAWTSYHSRITTGTGFDVARALAVDGFPGASEVERVGRRRVGFARPARALEQAADGGPGAVGRRAGAAAAEPAPVREQLAEQRRRDAAPPLRLEHRHVHDEQRRRAVRVQVVRRRRRRDEAPADEGPQRVVARVAQELRHPALVDRQVEQAAIGLAQQRRIGRAETAERIGGHVHRRHFLRDCAPSGTGRGAIRHSGGNRPAPRIGPAENVRSGRRAGPGHVACRSSAGGA